MIRGTIRDLRHAAELIDRCRLENRPEQEQLEQITEQLRQLTDRLSTKVILKVAEI
ncbi:MAG: hypothetical protein HKM95_04020 [Inquilinus sp.]|nr:hypothetical protein [Inquilinus sp.]